MLVNGLPDVAVWFFYPWAHKTGIKSWAKLCHESLQKMMSHINKKWIMKL